MGCYYIVEREQITYYIRQVRTTDSIPLSRKGIGLMYAMILHANSIRQIQNKKKTQKDIYSICSMLNASLHNRLTLLVCVSSGAAMRWLFRSSANRPSDALPASTVLCTVGHNRFQIQSSTIVFCNFLFFGSVLGNNRFHMSSFTNLSIFPCHALCLCVGFYWHQWMPCNRHESIAFRIFATFRPFRVDRQWPIFAAIHSRLFASLAT